MIDDIIRVVDAHNRWRRDQCVNMIASESLMSPMAEKYFLSDFAGRYNEHTSGDCHYQGTKYSYQIEEMCNDIFRKSFGTKFADCRPISGGVANLIIYSAFAKPGDSIVALGIPNGSHVSSTQWGMAGIRGLNSIDMVFNPKEMNIDVEKTIALINKVGPKVVMFGASMFLFPQPIREIKDQIDSVIKVAYDSAHVFGLVYNKEFQNPLEEGADFICSSTHKTFQGPQGGIIIGRKDLDEKDWKKIQTAIFPGTISNHHIHRIPSLAITALEMDKFGKEYARQVIKNAQALGQSLYDLGFNVLCPEKGFTKSHQVIVNVKEFGGGKTVACALEDNNMICNKMSLPSDAPQDATKNPSGIRLGSQELTRIGMKECDMGQVAVFFEKAVKQKKSVKDDVLEFRKDFQKIQYCF
ncbi:MAG: serine hydroxymethyltransferase [Candidatus Aenigmatarchaeota archaeon]